MVFFNYALRKLNAKIVYYGPGLCGKTTNLQWIHDHFEGGQRGKMISLATEGDRTIFFDLLPLDIGTIRGMDVTLQLYTVPGQVHYNSTRQLVLKGADGVVFVADSQRAMNSSNQGSWENLKENLLLQGVDLATFPHVLQFNKRDLRDIMSVEEMDAVLNEYDAPIFESVATEGIGVQETLEGIVKLVMRSLRDRYEPMASQGPVPAAPSGPQPAAPRPPAPVAAFRTPSAPVAPPPEPPRPAGSGSEVDEEAVTHPTFDAVREPEPPAREPEAVAGAPEPPGAEERPIEPESENETTLTIDPPVEEEGPTGDAVPEQGAEEFHPPVEGPAEAGFSVGDGAGSGEAGAPAWEDADVAGGAGEGSGEAEAAAGAGEEPFGTPGEEHGDEARESFSGGELGAEPFAAASGPEAPAEPGPVPESPEPPASETPEPTPEPPAPPAPPASVDDLVASVVDGASLPGPPRVEPVEPVEPPQDRDDRDAGGPGRPAEEEPPLGGAGQPAREVPAPEPVEEPREEPAAAPVQPEDSGAVRSPEEPPSGRRAEPVVLDPEDPFGLPEEPEAPLAAEASAVVAVPVATGDGVGDAPPSQLQIQLEGTQALARSGDVRELDILVPVPGAWIGNRRVTLQLRLTLVPAAEEES